MSSTKAKPAQAKNVKLIGHTDLDGWGDALQVVVQGNHAYVGAAGGGGPEGTTIVDITDRSKPFRRTSAPCTPIARSSLSANNSSKTS